MTSKFSTLALLLVGVLTLLLSGCDSAPAATQLATAQQKAQQCVEPTEVMRSQHMAMLMHQRDATVLQGIRTTQHSLKECINCHVAPTKADGSPLHYGDKEHFCTTCHVAVGVKLDCFQCHADRPSVTQNMGYQHAIGTQQGHHFVQGVNNALTPNATDMQLVAQSAAAPPTAQPVTQPPPVGGQP